MNLGEILENVQNSDFERLGEINDVEVHGLSYDSRLITSGDLFSVSKVKRTIVMILFMTQSKAVQVRWLWKEKLILIFRKLFLPAAEK